MIEQDKDIEKWSDAFKLGIYQINNVSLVRRPECRLRQGCEGMVTHLVTNQ